MAVKAVNIFPSVEQSTLFKRRLNEFKIFETGFADLNAHLIDAYIVNQHKAENVFRYFFLKCGWIISKLFRSFPKNTNSTVLFVPLEMDKDRSIGLYKPVFPFMNGKSYDVISISSLLNALSFMVLLKWLLKAPAIIKAALKALDDEDAPAVLKKIKWLLVIDSLFQYLWVLQLRSFFKQAAYRSLVVEWDRHKFLSLAVLAAKLEKITTYTFVHGAIYTPEKFVPLIADKCFAWGNDHVDFFTGLGEAGSKLIKAGNTRFTKVLPGRENVLHKYGIGSAKKIILHPSQNFPDLDDAIIIKNLHRFVSANNNFQLAVKFHPSQDNRALIKKISGLNDVILLDRSVSAREALAIASFVVVVSSTFSIDALMAGVPVAVYQPQPALRGIAADLVSKANTPLLKTEKDFAALLDAVEKMPADTCFNMASQQNFISNYCEYYGEESAKRIAGILN